MHAAHTFEDHTGELRVKLVAPALADLFAESGRALAEIILGASVLPPATGDPELVSLESRDRDALLVDWLDELVFRTEMTGRLYVEFRFDTLTDRRLSSWIRGTDPGERRTVVKAATLHGLHITEQSDGFSCTVLLDV